MTEYSNRKATRILTWRPGIGVSAMPGSVHATVLNSADPYRRHLLKLSADDAERLGRDLLFFAERARVERAAADERIRRATTPRENS